MPSEGMNSPATSSPEIHPTAIVAPDAEIGRGVTIGPYSVIGSRVSIGEGTEVMNHVTIQGPTLIGRNNRVFSYASLGQSPQDKKFREGEPSSLEIGDNNVIREFVTLNRGTGEGGGVTRIGHNNWIMAYCHVAHDCRIGNDTIFANNTTLGGHVSIADRVYLGGFTAIHQFCSVGELVMTGGHTMIAQDVPPYVIAVGNRASLFGINRIGLERAGLAKNEINALQQAYKIFFRKGHTATEALKLIEAELGHSPHVMNFVAFVRDSTRGIVR